MRSSTTRAAWVALQRVLPGLAVAGGAAVVDHGDRVAVVHERLDLGVPAVGVVVVGTAVDQQHGGVAAVAAGWGGQEAVHPVAARVAEGPALVGDAGGGPRGPGAAHRGVAAGPPPP